MQSCCRVTLHGYECHEDDLNKHKHCSQQLIVPKDYNALLRVQGDGLSRQKPQGWSQEAQALQSAANSAQRLDCIAMDSRGWPQQAKASRGLGVPGGVGALLGTNVTVSVVPGGRPGPATGVVAVPRGCNTHTHTHAVRSAQRPDNQSMQSVQPLLLLLIAHAHCGRRQKPPADAQTYRLISLMLLCATWSRYPEGTCAAH